jgi:hypothetical protein
MKRFPEKKSYTRLLKIFEKDLSGYCKILKNTQHELQYVIRNRSKFSTDDIQISLFITDNLNQGKFILTSKVLLKELQDYSRYFSIDEVRVVVMNPLIEKSTFLSPNKSIEERIFYEYYPNRLSSRNFEMWRANLL